MKGAYNRSPIKHLSSEQYNPTECFPSGTQILFSDGTTAAIETLVQSAFVSCFDGGTKTGRSELTSRKIVRLYQNVTDCFVRLEFSDGREPLTVTPGHHFLDETGAFTKIGDLLRLGKNTARLIDASGEIITAKGQWIYYSVETADMFERASTRAETVAGNTVTKEQVAGGWRTYNFEVEELHTYIAGGVRVHNMSGSLGEIGNIYDTGFNNPLGNGTSSGTVGSIITIITTKTKMVPLIDIFRMIF